MTQGAEREIGRPHASHVARERDPERRLSSFGLQVCLLLVFLKFSLINRFYTNHDSEKGTRRPLPTTTTTTTTTTPHPTAAFRQHLRPRLLRLPPCQQRTNIAGWIWGAATTTRGPRHDDDCPNHHRGQLLVGARGTEGTTETGTTPGRTGIEQRDGDGDDMTTTYEEWMTKHDTRAMGRNGRVPQLHDTQDPLLLLRATARRENDTDQNVRDEEEDNDDDNNEGQQ
jgi:hypothetical protein